MTTGTGFATVGGEKHDLTPGDVLYVPPNVDHESAQHRGRNAGCHFHHGRPHRRGTMAKLEAARESDGDSSL